MKKNAKKDFLSFIFISMLIVIFIFTINILSGQNNGEQLKNLENTVRKEIVHCYAVEGKYPESIDYLKLHYGLTYNEDIFYIDYLPIGSNIMPDFTIIYKGR